MLESLDTESVAEKERLDSAAMLGKGAREEDAQQRRKVRARKKSLGQGEKKKYAYVNDSKSRA